ncbi:hypothetical protein NC651_028955 [Populus alba x Populus x berolinensis]|nr:hypothetical protein NC651_028955 [Populus alba x Populus x berolinensis]
MILDPKNDRRKKEQERHDKQDVNSVPDSPMLETTSSFGSTSSSPSLANLSPRKVHMEDGGGKVVRIEDPLAQMTVGGGRVRQRQDEGFAALSSSPPMSVSIEVSSVPVGDQMVVGEYQNWVFSDDERSDHGVPRSSSGGGAAIDLSSPDSISRWRCFLKNPQKRPFSPACGYNVQVQEIVKASYGEQIQRIEKCRLCSTTHDERNQALHEEHAHTDHTYTHLSIEMARIITIITQL